MVCFIRSIHNYRPITYSVVLNYELKPNIYDTISTITIQTPKERIEEGNIVILDGQKFIGVIDSVSINEGETQLGCLQAISLFDFDFKWVGVDWSSQPIEQCLRLWQIFRIQEGNNDLSAADDAFFAKPYIYGDYTQFTSTIGNANPDIDENGIANFKSWLNKVRRTYNIQIAFTATNSQIIYTLQRKNIVYKNIDFDNASYKLLTEDYSKNGVSKLTTYCEENDSTQDWYLLTDGTITNEQTQENRLEGKWKILYVATADEVQTNATNELRRTQFSHKITFQCNKNLGYELYDNLKIRLNGKIFTSYITGLVEKMNSDIIEVQCGELQMQFPFIN